MPRVDTSLLLCLISAALLLRLEAGTPQDCIVLLQSMTSSEGGQVLRTSAVIGVDMSHRHIW